MSSQDSLTVAQARQRANGIMEAVSLVVLGKPDQIRLAVACLITRGHLLIEDVPGVGKTTLAHALAHSCGLAWRRLQFTSDLLPSDLLGMSIWDAKTSSFVFRPGPVFSEVVLTDEINRAPPKTQSALLEAMEERRVSVDGHTHTLPDPFFVIATQNPTHHSGTFELPESQLDRFLMRLSLGYPPAEAEIALLIGADRPSREHPGRAHIDRATLLAMQRTCSGIYVGETLARYVRTLLDATRHHPDIATGLSPRAGLALLAAARALALIDGREFVTPEDIQAVWHPVTNHRLHGHDGRALPVGALDSLLRSVAIA